MQKSAIGSGRKQPEGLPNADDNGGEGAKKKHGQEGIDCKGFEPVFQASLRSWPFVIPLGAPPSNPARRHDTKVLNLSDF